MLKLNQQILIRSTHVNCNQPFQQLNHQDSYQKILITPNNRKKSSEHIHQKQNFKAEIYFQERKKQNSIPDILQLQSNFIKCHTHTNNQLNNKDYEIQSKKLKTFHNQDISPKRICQDASPLQNIIINRKRTCVSENKKELFNELQKKPKQKIPNHLQIFNQDFDQPSNRITFQASTYIEDGKQILKSIETPGTAQFMQSNKDDNFVYVNENVYQNMEQNCYPEQQIQQRRLSCQEETFMPVQKTIQTKQPYFQSKKGNQDHYNKLECRKIMTILDIQQDRIFESIGLNSSEIHHSPRSDGLNKTLNFDNQIKKYEESGFIQQNKSKRNIIKDENQPYWKLREISQSKKKR